MNSIIEGRVWKFGDNISTDLMYPGTVMHGKVPHNERKWGCMSANRPEFARSVQPNDIVVAGKNFGCGSSRPANELLMDLQVGCVLADSFAAIFFRNCISGGLPSIELEYIGDMFSDGDTARVDLNEGLIQNRTTGKTCSFIPYPKEIVDILMAGGVIEYIKNEA